MVLGMRKFMKFSWLEMQGGAAHTTPLQEQASPLSIKEIKHHHHVKALCGSEHVNYGMCTLDPIRQINALKNVNWSLKLHVPALLKMDPLAWADILTPAGTIYCFSFIWNIELLNSVVLYTSFSFCYMTVGSWDDLGNFGNAPFLIVLLLTI